MTLLLARLSLGRRSLFALSLTLCLPLAHAAKAPSAGMPWVGTWAASQVAAQRQATLGPTTLREIVHVSRGGMQLRVTLSNEFGTESLKIAAASVATVGGADGVSGTVVPLTFGGEPQIIIPPGAVAVSDAAALKLAGTSDLAVSLFLPAQTISTWTVHETGLQKNYAGPGDQVTAAHIDGAQPFEEWRFLTNVEVSGPGAAIVALGDSITDGYRSTTGTNNRWPDELARRLQANGKTSALGVLNEGIGGNRVLHDVTGPNALARFDRDVLAQSGVRYLVVLEGINDIGRSSFPHDANDVITAAELISGFKQIIERAHAHGIKVYGATLTPFVGAGYANPAGEAMRQAVNTFIRTGGKFDGVIDFDKATRDPAAPEKFLPAYDCDDHLHPSDAGYKAMGDSIDLSLFTK